MGMPEYRNAQIPRKEIFVDDSLNARKTPHDESTINKLTDSIKKQGLIHPPTVIRVVQLGEGYVRRLTENVKYVLIAGFRRQQALDQIQPDHDKQVNDYRIAPEEWDIADALLANLGENLGREDLTSYELAHQCVVLRDDHNLTAKDISAQLRSMDSEVGDRKPLSEAHINNMMRCMSNLHHDILQAWQEQHPKAKLRTLIQLAAMDENEQLRSWRGVVDPDSLSAEADGGESDEDRPKKPIAKRRPTPAQIAVKIDAAKQLVKEAKKSPDWGKGVTEALRWAAGLVDRIPGIKDPEPQPEEE